MPNEKGLYSRAKQGFEEKFLPLQIGKTFTSDDVYKFFGLNAKSEHIPYKKALGDVLYNLSKVNKNPTLEQKGKVYRIIDRDLKVIDWHKNTEKGTVKFVWPYGPQDQTTFGFDENILLYKGDMVVLAGEGNRGKTAFALNVLANNLEMPCYYFTSEFNPPKFRDRMQEFKWVTIFKDDGTPRFTLCEQTDNWHDVIQPDALNIIDWIKLEDNMYKIRGIMDGIKAKLRDGLAVIITQKRTNKQYGEGGEYAKDLASVYLLLSYDDKNKENILYVDKVKTPNPDATDPNFKKYAFNIYRGAEFANIRLISKQ